MEPATLCAIAVMAKAPRAGRVKTRLSPPLTPDQAEAMSRAFLRDLTDNLIEAGRIAPLSGFVAYAPIGSEALFDGVLADGTKLLLADGTSGDAPGVEGFGRSLLHAVRSMFALGFGSCCVLNADSPTLPTALLCRAADLLRGPRNRIVLGPADDGGYYLLGMRACHVGLFADIAWSTSEVAVQTRARAKALGLEVVELPSWFDIDDAAALARFAEPEPVREDGLIPYAASFSRVCLAQIRAMAA